MVLNTLLVLGGELKKLLNGSLNGVVKVEFQETKVVVEMSSLLVFWGGVFGGWMVDIDTVVGEVGEVGSRVGVIFVRLLGDGKLNRLRREDVSNVWELAIERRRMADNTFNILSIFDY